MNTVDQLIHGFDGLLRTVARVKPQAQNRSPAEGALDEPLTADEKTLGKPNACQPHRRNMRSRII